MSAAENEQGAATNCRPAHLGLVDPDAGRQCLVRRDVVRVILVLIGESDPLAGERRSKRTHQARGAREQRTVSRT